MREPMKTNLKMSARLFQVPSEVLEGCFVCLNLSHRLIVSEVMKLCALGTFYVDLQCTLISGHCTGRELTTATLQ